MSRAARVVVSVSVYVSVVVVVAGAVPLHLPLSLGKHLSFGLRWLKGSAIVTSNGSLGSPFK